MLRQVFAAREYQWRQTGDPLAWLRDRIADLLRWLVALHQAHPAAYLVLLAALLTIAIALLVHVGYVVSRALARAAPARPGAAPRASPARDASWHLAEARRLGAGGRFAEALGHRYLALVLLLAQRRALTFHASKTPLEYAAEARLDPDARAALAALTGRLYAHLFGGASCGTEEWSRFDRDAAALASRAAPA